mgnify:FL=1
MTSSGPKRPGTLRRLSEKNINFARSVGRRLSTMLNLPIVYDMKDPNMMDSIPETEPSPPSRRRDSVTVRPKEGEDVTYVSVYPIDKPTSCENCKRRRRLVDSSVQTADVRDANYSSVNKSKKNPFSFITSISIKSGVSKSANKRTAYGNQAFHCSKSFDHNQFKTDQSRDSRTKDADDNVLSYNVDDLPRNRSSSARSLPEPPRALSPPLDYHHQYLSSFKRDSSFNDGSILNEEGIYEKLGSERKSESNENIVHENSVRFSNCPASVVAIDQYVDDVRYVADGRVTPVEDYYEPIEIVQKTKNVKRQHSTHV